MHRQKKGEDVMQLVSFVEDGWVQVVVEFEDQRCCVLVRACHEQDHGDEFNVQELYT
jgi:acylphosphatase